MAGTYLLYLLVNESKTIMIGRQKTNFQPGLYVYVGYAPNDLEKRIDRHLKMKRRKHWPIDFLIENAEVVGVKTFENVKAGACDFVKKLAEVSEGHVPGFDCPDCECECESHLYYFGSESEDKINKALEETIRFE
ncbi:MAG: GIY-YIG nuclease family protein [Candidatus Micrarchaeia archaeon]